MPFARVPSAWREATCRTCARVAELADALASGASDRKVVEVRVLSRAPSNELVSGASLCSLRFESSYRVEERGFSGRNQGKDQVHQHRKSGHKCRACPIKENWKLGALRDAFRGSPT